MKKSLLVFFFFSVIILFFSLIKIPLIQEDSIKKNTKGITKRTIKRNLASSKDSLNENRNKQNTHITDPKKVYFEKIKSDMANARVKFGKILRDQQQKPEYITYANKLLNSNDGHLKEIGLHIASTQKPNIIIFHSILEDVLSYHDKNLIEASFLELARYQLTPGMKESLLNQLTNTINHGSLFVALQVIKKLPLLAAMGKIDLSLLASRVKSQNFKKQISQMNIKR